MIVALAVPTYNPDDVKPGWVALGLVVLLALATFLLWRSMNTQLKRINVPTSSEARQTRLDLEAAGSADRGEDDEVDSTDTDQGPAPDDPDLPGESRNGLAPGPRH